MWYRLWFSFLGYSYSSSVSIPSSGASPVVMNHFFFASLEETHGVFHQVFGHCLSRFGDIRLCTTEKNVPMMRALESHSFSPVGTLRRGNGLEMVGYQRMMERRMGSSSSLMNFPLMRRN